MSRTTPNDLFTPRPLALACAIALAALTMAGGQAWGHDVFGEPTPAERAAASAAVTPPSSGAHALPGQPGWNLSTLQQLKDAPTPQRMDLAHAWRLAVLHDPNYQAALSARAAAETERRQGRAALLPQAQAGYSRSRIRGGQTQYDRFGTGHVFDLDYDSSHTYIQLQQPIIDYGRYADFRRGAARAELGVAEFREREQATALELTYTYLRALDATTRLTLAERLAESLAQQAKAQDRLYEASEGDRIDAQETRARLAIAESDVISARDDVKVAMRELASMTGGAAGPIAPLKAGFTPQPLQPARLDDWLALAQTQNPAVRVAEQKLRVAETELKRATARHLPTLSLVVGYAKADSENLETLSQRTNTWSAGLQASIPLFSGGYSTANRARASAELEQARQELRVAQETAAAEVTRQYTAVVTGAERVKSLEDAVASSELSLAAARESYRYGVRSNVDVLRSQDRLYEAARELAQARLNYLAAVAALWAAVGELDEPRLNALSATQLDAALEVLP